MAFYEVQKVQNKDEKHESGVTLKWAFLNHFSTEPQKSRIFTKGKRHFLQWELMDDPE